MPGLPASCTASGQCMGMPDVCLTPAPPAPPIPIPYPNMAMVAQASKTSTKVKIGGMPAVIEMSEIAQSMGDEAGTNGGVISGVNMKKVAFVQGSSMVMIEGKGAAHITSICGHNGPSPNMPAGAQIAPSQAKVLVAP
jgi:hypothetical protein